MLIFKGRMSQVPWNYPIVTGTCVQYPNYMYSNQKVLGSTSEKKHLTFFRLPPLHVVTNDNNNNNNTLFTLITLNTHLQIL